MKKIVGLLLVVIIITSCNRKFDLAMKSADKNFILKMANELFTKKKWASAIALYERLPNLVAGTDDAKTVIFNTAYASYYDKQYRIAGHHFKNFSNTFGEDYRAEEAAYMSALCYYKGSLDYNLDQLNTESAINELQSFINKYPDSERAKNINSLIEELSYKIEYKAFENAKQYYKMSEPKASIVAFENVLDDYPGTKLRPQIYSYLLKSKSELSFNSKYDKKEERINTAMAYTKFIQKEMPKTDLAKTARDLEEKLGVEKKKHEKLKALVEEQKAKFEKKQNELEKEKTAILYKDDPKQKRIDITPKKDSISAIDKTSGEATFRFNRN